MRSDIPRVTFGIIVLNGEPFTRYNLRALYPSAHEIIVVEGVVPVAASIATRDGHSTDGTLEALYRFKAEEDHYHSHRPPTVLDAQGVDLCAEFLSHLIRY